MPNFNYDVVNILDALDSSGEDVVKNIVSTFSCKNYEVEDFIKTKSIEFAKSSKGITYFVIDKTGIVQGAFTISVKYATIPKENISITVRKKVKRCATYDISQDIYITSAYLIGQFGKNDSVRRERQISGVELMDIALSILRDVKRSVGGNIVWLECEEDNEKAYEFYRRQEINFVDFGSREGDNGITYLQMLKSL